MRQRIIELFDEAKNERMERGVKEEEEWDDNRLDASVHSLQAARLFIIKNYEDSELSIILIAVNVNVSECSENLWDMIVR